MSKRWKVIMGEGLLRCFAIGCGNPTRVHVLGRSIDQDIISQPRWQIGTIFGWTLLAILLDPGCQPLSPESIVKAITYSPTRFDLPPPTGKAQHDLPETRLHFYLGVFQEHQLPPRLLQGSFLIRPTIVLHTSIALFHSEFASSRTRFGRRVRGR